MKSVAIALAVTALAGAATAQPLDLSLPTPAADISGAPLAVGPQLARPMPDLANPLDPLAPPTPQADSLDSAVFAKTAVDAKVAGRSDLTAAFGFLCGLKPGHTESGGAAAFGSDPHGRFVGAKLSLAF